MLISPSYGHASKTAERRNHQTIRGLSDRLGVEITADFAKGQEPQLATVVLNSGICEVDGLARCSRLSGRLGVDYLPCTGIRSLVDSCGDLRLFGPAGGARWRFSRMRGLFSLSRLQGRSGPRSCTEA